MYTMGLKITLPLCELKKHVYEANYYLSWLGMFNGQCPDQHGERYVIRKQWDGYHFGGECYE